MTICFYFQKTANCTGRDNRFSQSNNKTAKFASTDCHWTWATNTVTKVTTTTSSNEKQSSCGCLGAQHIDTSAEKSYLSNLPGLGEDTPRSHVDQMRTHFLPVMPQESSRLQEKMSQMQQTGSRKTVQQIILWLQLNFCTYIKSYSLLFVHENVAFLSCLIYLLFNLLFQRFMCLFLF